MFNSEDEAWAELNELKKRIHESESWKREQSELAYNYDEPAVLQLLEVFEQKSKEWDEHFWEWLNGQEGSPPWMREVMQGLTRQLDEEDFSYLTLLEHQIQYEEELNRGRGVVVVAHSQGNFFANRMSVILAGEGYPVDDFFRIVGVANPSRYSDEGTYYTLKSDGIIRMIPDALPPNIENQTPTPGRLDHQFIKHYLNGTPTGDRIVTSVEELMAGMAKRTAEGDESDKQCLDWYKTLKLPNNDYDGCVLKCGSAMRDMSNFDCLSCERICECQI